MADSEHTRELDGVETTKVLVSELQRVYGRLENSNDGTTSVIQFIVLVFGAGALVATEIPEAVVAIPVFWTVWLLYAVMTDMNTLKYAVLARHLEAVVNERLPSPVFAWESVMAERGNDRPMIYWANYVYWATLNASAWIVAIAVLWNEGHELGGVAAAATWAATWAAGLRSGLFQRAQFEERFQSELHAYSGWSTTEGPHPSEQADGPATQR